MRVSDVDIDVIHKLLKSVPEGMEIKSINLVNGYTLELVAGTQELYEYEKELVLQEMNNLLNYYKRLDTEQQKVLQNTTVLKGIINKE